MLHFHSHAGPPGRRHPPTTKRPAPTSQRRGPSANPSPSPPRAQRLPHPPPPARTPTLLHTVTLQSHPPPAATPTPTLPRALPNATPTRATRGANGVTYVTLPLPRRSPGPTQPADHRATESSFFIAGRCGPAMNIPPRKVDVTSPVIC